MSTIHNSAVSADVAAPASVPVHVPVHAPEFSVTCSGVSSYPVLLYDLESHSFGWARKIQVSDVSGRTRTYVYRWHDREDDQGSTGAAQRLPYAQAVFLSGNPVAVVQAGRISSRTGYHAVLASTSSDFLYKRTRVLECPQGRYLSKDQLAILAKDNEDYLAWKYAAGFHTAWYFQRVGVWEPNWVVSNLPEGEPFHPTDDLSITYLADSVGVPEWVQYSIPSMPYRSVRGYRMTPVGGGQYPPCRLWLRWFDRDTNRHTVLAQFSDVWEVWRNNDQIANYLPGVYLIEVLS